MKIKILTTAVVVGLTLIGISGCSSPTYSSKKIVPATLNTLSNREGTFYCLPKGYIHLMADLQDGTTSSPKTPYYKITTIEVTLVPDTTKMYLLSPKTSSLAHDRFGITVTNNFLTSINSSNADQSGQVLVKLAALAGDIVQLLAPKLVVPTIEEKPTTNLPLHIDIVIDPDNTDQEILRKANLRVKAYPPSEVSIETGSDAPLLGKNQSSQGIFYRPLLPWTVTIDDGNNLGVQTLIVMLPNNAPVLTLVPRRTPMVTAITSITFDRGCLTGFTYDRESPALAWASLPLDMIKAFISAPTELIQLKFNFANTNSQLIKAQSDELANELTLLKQQIALQEFMRTNSAPK